VSKQQQLDFHTRVIHACQTPAQWGGATLPPIVQATAHACPTAEHLSQTFAGQTNDHIYMRLTNPTSRVLEEKLADLEGGGGTVVTGSGMAAITDACMALLRAGDEFVCGNSLFMSTYILFANVFAKYNITARFVEATDMAALAAAINAKTRFIYLETLGNPKLDVPDLRQAAAIAHDHGLPLIVDNTLVTPFLCRPLELGADVVIHSTTKYLNGHGDACGGAIIDGGTFPWNDSSRFPDLRPYVDRKGPLAYLDKVWREHHINFGTTPAPLHSYLTLLGLDTLALRMERHCANAMEVARFLLERPEVAWVNYPGLADHPGHATAATQFGGRGFGGMLTFGLANKEQCAKCIDHLQLIYHLANIGDCKTLIIHPYTTQYLSFPEALRRKLSIGPDLLRLSVGIEAVQDICHDLGQSLDRLGA